MNCPRCGLALPPVARFCARCGAPLRPGPAAAGSAPVWLLALLWVGAAGLVGVAFFYGTVGAGLVTPQEVGASVNQAQVQPTAWLIAICAASLAAGHVAAAVGLMGSRSWARTFATLVCVVWSLTCVGLPLGLLGINALWRGRQGGPARV